MPMRLTRVGPRDGPAGRRARRAILAGLLAAASPVLWPVARAQSPDPRIHGDAVVILDASGSMRGPVLGEPERPVKFDLARQAAGRLVEKLGRDLRDASLGIVAFGLTPAPGLQSQDQAVRAQARRDSCRDVTVVQPLAPATPRLAEGLRRRLDGFTMHGETPLGLAVSEAARLLVRGGSLVVVTDMESTCEGETGENAVCGVIRSVNTGRPPSDRVYIDAILVLPPSRDPGTGKPLVPDAVAQLGRCGDAVAPSIRTITTSAEIEEETDAIARRLARLTARNDLDRPRESDQASPETPRTVRIIDGEGRAVDGRRFDLHLSDGRRLPGRTGPMPLPTGASSLDVSFENGARIRIEAPSADVVVTLAP